MNSFKPKDNLILTIYVTFVLLIVPRMLKNCLKICVEEHVFGKQTTESFGFFIFNFEHTECHYLGFCSF